MTSAIQHEPSELGGGSVPASWPGARSRSLFLRAPEAPPAEPSRPEIRHALGHRFVTDPGGDDRCLGCGWNGAGQITECRPGTPRCEQCQTNPADVTEYIGGERFDLCGECR